MKLGLHTRITGQFILRLLRLTGDPSNEPKRVTYFLLHNSFYLRDKNPSPY